MSEKEAWAELLKHSKRFLCNRICHLEVDEATRERMMTKIKTTLDAMNRKYIVGHRSLCGDTRGHGMKSPSEQLYHRTIREAFCQRMINECN